MAFDVKSILSGSSKVALNISATETSVYAFTWPQADPSVLSSWTYLASLTPNSRLNRLILDVFEGQLITCVIITGFILVFLIREWVVQQQPLVNLDNVQQQLREAAERVQADNERLRRQQELLEQARARLMELQNETENYVAEAAGVDGQAPSSPTEFVGWDAVAYLIDKATGHLRAGGGAEHARFLASAANVIVQIRAHSRAGGDVEELSDKVFHKLKSYSEEERKEWEAILVSEIKRLNGDKGKQNIAAESQKNEIDFDTGEETLRVRIRKLSPSSDEADKRKFSAELISEIKKAKKETQEHRQAMEPPNGPLGGDAESAEASTARSRRPPMPDRDFSSRATHIQRLLTEAEEVFNASRGESSSARRADGQASNDTPSVISEPSSESWQEVTPPNEPNASSTPAVTSTMDWKKTTIPITNAGPDAKINIRWSRTSRAPEGLKIQERMLDVDEKLVELNDELAKETEQDRAGAAATEEQNAEQIVENPSTSENNPFHPDGPEPEQRHSESFGDRVANAFRDELGLEDVEDFEEIHREDTHHGEQPPPTDPQSPETPPQEPQHNPPTRWERLADWFWGDIQAPNTPEAPPTAGEEREEADAEHPAQVAPFVPAQAEQPAPDEPQLAEAEPELPPNDPEVVAAAQQAGIDPEAIEDAEDLEGIFELIGLQGPLIGLFQTSAFCLLLVACTILGAVILPYLGGKGVLSLVGSPVYFLLQLPLQVASFIVDFLIDTTLMVLGVIAIVAALAVDFGLAAIQTWMPSLGDRDITEQIIGYCTTTIANAANRLRGLSSLAGSVEGWGWAFLRWSVHSHASLKTIQSEVDTVLHTAGAAITWIVETVSSGSVLAVCKECLSALTDVPRVSESIFAGVSSLQDRAKPLIDGLSGLMRGTLTFSNSEAPINPSLVYWDSTDRALAIFAGYVALAALAAIYVAADTPITKSEAGQKTEKMIRDTLRQAGGVFKVILIISIEMLVFPLYCGLLLDIAFLPLFKNADVASRWAFAGRKPTLFCFVHWFVGTCYMFHFALFVGMCRKILRKGVLWFIRDPDDPTFHPVRDVLERNVATQLRKIAFSALVYGALVILCLGGVIWTIGHVFHDIFPIHWVSTEPILEFPLDMLLYNFVTPIVIRLMKPSDAVNSMYAWWLRKCARALRLSHFLFDDRRKDEEGHFVHQSWSSFLLMKNPDQGGSDATEPNYIKDEAHFKKDGMYVLTPCNDQYRPPKSEEAFFHLDENDACIVDKDGKKNEHFAKVYIPPLFRIRISLFMICLWLFSAFAGLCSTLVPLVLGRYLLSKFLRDGLRVSDIYAYSLGAYIVGGVLFAALKGKATAAYIRHKASVIDARAWVEPMKRFGIKALKCMYVYGFMGVILPTIFALFLQFYVVLPLHTWAASAAASAASDLQLANNTTLTALANFTQTFASNATHSSDNQLGSAVEHTFHVFQDYTLGLLYVRVFGRMIVATPASRAAEAFRRITADGYLNPNVRLATRFFVLPASIVAAMVLTVPPVLAKLAIVLVRSFVSDVVMDQDAQMKLYRYSYPIAASIIVAILGAMELGKATSRWRARIRDEAYLVGERLHNFGEKKPPPGSKSVVRKDR
jgi:E3 ubiquitin-protein ligase MARCH6